MFQQLREDAREFPATMALSAAWVAVFAWMVLDQARGPGLSLGELALRLGGGHKFGDMTIGELYAGEIWRTVTATFVHYGLIHIGLNIYALYQLGCLVESWYGPGPLVGIYVVTGGVGNLLSGIVRKSLGWSPVIPSGGGSVVVMGLVGLCAVVGWRSRTRLGDYLRNQMVWVLLLTAGIGVGLSVVGLPIIDNWGHACGAAVGAVLGLANRPLTAYAGRWPAQAFGWFGAAVLAASGAAQVADDRRAESDQKQIEAQAIERLGRNALALRRLDEVRKLYNAVAEPRKIVRGTFVPASVLSQRAAGPTPSPRPSVPPLDPAADRELYDGVLKATIRAFDSLRPVLDTGVTNPHYRRARELLIVSLGDPPTVEELREFNDRIETLGAQLRQEQAAAQFQLLFRRNSRR